MGDLATRSARPLEFLLLIAGEHASPGSVSAQDIRNALDFGRILDETCPPAENVPRDGTFIPYNLRIPTFSTEKLKAELDRSQRIYDWSFTDGYAYGAMSAGGTSADVLADRQRAYETLNLIREELSQRAPAKNNVVPLRRPA